MRIVMLSHGYPPTISGVSLIAMKYSRMLVGKGHYVRVITSSDVGKAYKEDDQGVEIIRLHSYANPYWREGRFPSTSVSELTRLIQDSQADLVHTHDNGILGFQLLRCKDHLKIPLVASAYSLPQFATNYVALGKTVDQLLRTIVWKYFIYILNQHDRVIFSNPTLQGFYLEHGLECQSVIISNGADAQRYQPADGNPSDIEMKYRLPAHPRILHVGRLAADKRIEVLLEAMPEIHAKSRAHLLIVGRGDHRPELESIIDALGIENCVHFLGFVPESDLPKVYQASDLFTIVGSSETQSIPTLQALFCGLPVILVNAACLPELVEPGENGFLIPPEDPKAVSEAIIKIFTQPGLAQRFGQVSLQIAEPHSQRRSLDAFINLYESMLV